MNKRIIFTFLLIILLTPFTSCYNEKNSPFYDSEWIMKNVDQNNQLYYHHLILNPDHKVMLRSSYADSTNIIVWRGTYKINSKKIVFNFEDCSRFENGENVGQYKDKRLVKYYTGDFYYSLGKAGNEDNEQYHLQLIRPVNHFYGENKDIFGNYLEEFVKIDNITK